MPKYFAQIDANKQVLRVVVCNDAAWLESRLGGTWVETKIQDATEKYAPVGGYQAAVSPDKFVIPWRQPAGAHDAYDVGAWVWHNGLVWENLTPANVWEPGVTGWRDPLNAWPEWVQPLGAQDAYRLNAQVSHNGFHWINTGSDANVWEPGVFGWTKQ